MDVDDELLEEVGAVWWFLFAMLTPFCLLIVQLIVSMVFSLTFNPYPTVVEEIFRMVFGAFSLTSMIGVFTFPAALVLIGCLRLPFLQKSGWRQRLPPVKVLRFTLILSCLCAVGLALLFT